MKKRLTIFGIYFLLSAFCSAQEAGWFEASKIKRIVITTNGGINIKLVKSVSGCSSLSGYGGAYASVHPDHPGIERIYSLLLTAYIAEQEVQFHFADETCKINEVVIGGTYNS